MSKARITFRFENTRRASGQAAGEAPLVESTPLERDEPGDRTIQASREPERESADREPQESKRPAGNVIPLRHYEFEVSEEPVVIEERGGGAPKKPFAGRRLEPDYPYDYGAWRDVADAEADELERLIRATDAYEPEGEREDRARSVRLGDGSRGPRLEPPELRAPGLPVRDWEAEEEAADRDAESGYWAGSDVGRPPRSSRASRASAVRRTEEGPAWWKVAGSVVGAIATGILFGTFMLNFFAGDPAKDAGTEAESNPPAATAPTEHAANASAGDAAAPAGNEPAAAASATIDLPERRMFLLQNGKFETLDAARTLAESMKSKGLAATIEEGDGFYVYAGVTSNRDAALRAGVKLQAEGVEVYVKPYELPSVSRVRWSDGSAEALAGYVAKGSDMVRMIGDLTLVHLEGDAPVAPEAATLEKVKSEHLALTELQAGALAGLPAEAQPMLSRMDAAVRNAVVAIEEYGAHPDHAYLWSAQSALMDYLIAEKQLLTTIATN